MRKEDTQRILIALPKSMYEAIKRQADRNGVPMAAYIRFAVEKLLQADGEKVRDDILWGGARYTPSEDDEEDEVVAVTAR